MPSASILYVNNGGANGIRTRDLIDANDALSQLSYSPKPHALYSYLFLPSTFRYFIIDNMDFSGFEKLSLLDFDHYLTATLFYGGCPFRCPYCHNAALVLHPETLDKIPWEEIKNYLKKRQGCLEAVCISGGEPTMMDDLIEKVKDLKELGYLVKIDTNGINPSLLKYLVSNALVDYVAMDIKNSPDKYAKTIGLDNFKLENIYQSVDYLLANHVSYEFRTTVVEEFHDFNDFKIIGEWIAGAQKYYLQQYVDRDGAISHGFTPYSKEKALEALKIVQEFVPNSFLRGYD